MDKHAKSSSLQDLLTGLGTKFIIPEYQRDYSWKSDQVEELWDDIISSYENNKSYFMGPVVLCTEGNSKEDECFIVDGQQRFATFTIFFSAVRSIGSHFRDHPDDPVYKEIEKTKENHDIADKLKALAEDRILYRTEPDHYYLKLNKKDHSIFEKNIQTKNPPLLTVDGLKIKPADRLIIKTQKIFFANIKEKFLRHKDGIKILYDCLAHVTKHIYFWDIKVNSDTDAYLLFESLNSKGLDLSISDLLKNRMLMLCGSDISKKELILDHWEQMISSLEESKFSPADFLRYYWIAFHKFTTKKELYRAIREHLTNENVLIQSQKFLKYAKFFSEITKKTLIYPSTEYSKDSINKYFAEINTLNYKLAYPLFLVVKEKNERLFKKLLPQIISFLFRLVTVGEFSVGKAENFFRTAEKNVKDGKSENDILNIFKDDEISDKNFADKFTSRNYTNDIGKYILIKIYEDKTGKEILVDTKIIHLEHIFPVSHKDHWEGFDKKNKEYIDWIQNIGNMTLLNGMINRSASNKKFSEKVLNHYKKKENDEEGTSISLTYDLNERYIKEPFEWNADEISKRATDFAKKSKKIWKLE
jgi:uncharacterized protein with ParB-like and HNH nuclease domain